MKALSTEGVPPSEFARTMAPHPLMYQELPHDPEYQLYNDRLTPVRFADVTADEMYWKVRREVILRHTGELPIEFVGPDIDREAVGDRILEVGRSFGMIITSAQVFRARRIEAGLLNAGSDFDRTVTPFEAGFGGFVDFDKNDFIGKAALERADCACRTWGLRTEGGIAQLGRAICRDGAPVGRVSSTAWSPFLQCGVAIVRMDGLADGPGTQLDVESYDGIMLRGELCTLPMYDPDRLIPRGRLIDIPDQ